MSLPEPPTGWGSDGLTEFLDRARGNAYAAFHNLPDEYGRLRELNEIFDAAAAVCEKECDPLPTTLMMRVHSAFLASVQLVMNAQVPESYACLRLALECALYSHYLSRRQELQEVWLRRHDDEDSQRIVRREFRVGAMRTDLSSRDAAVARVFGQLYERTIDMGAHPNQRAITTNMMVDESDSGTRWDSIYLATDGLPLRVALKTCAQVGVCTLEIARLVFPERFALVGLDEKIRAAGHDI